eukprot:CAMPEP_0114598978 /NCGR_PEP_ID=MMETSP0125-20121206/21422_1 /TAXON_ID=485358 ORGANISM="Aristerostoma sp., Strain ATCC 50986" /NCGR_SAMPLE_ID=MMETSP0125 /ASSEMBLY_ACC=CAM_ASM_000245 /LENGTH=54 /DNA_ID=CAMNT_0001805397 /DNA_START=239 /DNA_END=403 /DNA_ORIENTATION=+
MSTSKDIVVFVMDKVSVDVQVSTAVAKRLVEHRIEGLHKGDQTALRRFLECHYL